MSNDALNQFITAQNNLVVQHSDFSLKALFDMTESGSIDLAPHYQRRERWTPAKQSALVESFILNVPVPPIYLSEDEFGHYSVIDGKQRITTIRDFLSGSLRLNSLSRFRDLEGCRFSDLPMQIQNALSIRPYIRVITLLKQTDPSLKYEVFLRLNTGGEKLRAQEIRNVAFSGTFNDLLITLSGNTFLRERMKIKNKTSTSYRNMDDVEHVLRFFTINERWKNIGQLLTEEMDQFMRDNRDISPHTEKLLTEKFEFSINSCKEIWGAKAFYKPQATGWRGQFISPLYDAEMTAVTYFTAKEIEAIARKRSRFLDDFKTTFHGDQGFAKSINQSTNNPASIGERIKTTVKILKRYI